MNDLHHILSQSTPTQRAPDLTAWFRTAPAEALAASIDLAWFDHANAEAIADGLQDRSKIAIPLAEEAWRRDNGVIRWTALRVLERHPQATDFLAELAQAATPPLCHHLEAAQARAEERYEALLASKARERDYLEQYAKQLESAKKGDRHSGLYVLRQTHDPWYASRLAVALEHEQDLKLFKDLAAAVVEILGFEAIPALSQRLEGDFLRPALEALAQLGDRSVPAYLFAHLEEKGLVTWQQACLARYRLLALPLLLDLLRGLADWRPHKAALADIFMVMRDDRLVEALFVEAEGESDFARRFLEALPVLYPKCLKKKKGLTLAQLRPYAATLLGGRTLELPGLTSARLDPEGRGLLLVRNHRRVEWLDLATGRAETLLGLPERAYLSHLGLSPDGRRLLVTHTEGGQPVRYQIGVWEYGRWDQPLGQIETGIQPQTVAMTHDHRWLLVGGNQRVQRFSCTDWSEAPELPGHEGTAYYLQSMPDGRFLTGDWAGWLQVWNTATWEAQARIKCDSWARKFARLSTDSKLLVYAGHVGLHVWETDTWREIAAVTKSLGNHFMSLSPDNRYVLIVVDKKLKFLAFGTWQEVLTLEDDTALGMPAFGADGRTLVTLGRHRVRVWNLDALDGCRG
jgi:hypothetical protein